MNAAMAKESLDVEEKTRLTLSQQIAFRTACSEIGIHKADVMRALILKFIRDHYQDKALPAVGLHSTSASDTE